MVFIRSLLVLCFIVLLTFSAIAQEKQDSKEKPAVIVRQGEIKIVGHERFSLVELRSNERKDILSGDVAEELRRIPGHKVKIWAVIGEDIQGQATLLVVRYEILDSGEERKPYVGYIGVKDGLPALIIEDLGDPLPLTGNSQILRLLSRQAGAKVWIIGGLVADGLKVSKFGVLRQAPQ